MPVPKKMRPAEDKYGGDSDHQSDGEGGVQPMMTKIKTVLKSELGGGACSLKYTANTVLYVPHICLISYFCFFV